MNHLTPTSSTKLATKVFQIFSHYNFYSLSLWLTNLLLLSNVIVARAENLCYVCSTQSLGADILKCEQQLQLSFLNQTNSSVILNSALDYAISFKNISSDFPSSSSLRYSIQKTIPTYQSWSRCEFCAYEHGNITIFDEANILHQNFKNGSILAKSRYSSHFPPYGDMIYGFISNTEFNKEDCNRVFLSPVYIVQLLHLHVGHMMVDVLEPLYNMMIAEYGYVRKDSIIFLDVSHFDSKQNFPLNIAKQLQNSPFRLLKSFTDNTIHSKWALDRWGGRTCFKDLHIGLSLDSYLHDGYRNHPDIADPLKNPQQYYLLKSYQKYQKYLLFSAFRLPILTKPPSTLKITILNRVDGRRLLNLNDVKNLGLKYGSVNVTYLESLTLSDQIKLLRKTSILVGVYGTGMHNCLFLPKGAVMILIMQDSWCDYKWTFANQAIYSGIHVFVYCNSPRYYGVFPIRFSEGGIARGPWKTRNSDVNVELSLLDNLFKKAAQLLSHDEGVLDPKIHHIVYTNTTFLQEYITHRPNFSLRVSFLDLYYHNHQISFVPQILVQKPKILKKDPKIMLCVLLLSFNSQSFQEPQCIPYGIPHNLYIENVPVDQHFLFAWLMNISSNNPSLIEKSETLELIPSIESSTKLQEKIEYCFKNKKLNLDESSFCLRIKPMLRIPVVIPVQINEKLYYFFFGVDQSGTEIEMLAYSFCKSFDIVSSDCLILLKLAYQKQLDRKLELEYAVSLSRINSSILLPEIQNYPTVKNPFVFLHHEKCAGSSLRKYLDETCKKLTNLTCLIPGKGDLPHMTFNLKSLSPSYSSPQVLAGHFQWDVWNDFPRESSDFSCFIMLRNPIDRIISFYYERIFPLNLISMNDLKVTQLQNYLKSFLGSAFSLYRDEGISNALCRMLCGSINRAGKSPISNPLAMPFSIELAQLRLKQCVIGKVEDWKATTKILRHWFPWINISTEHKRNIGFSDKETSSTLRKDLLNAILLENRCDEAIYSIGMTIFEKQLLTVNNKSESQENLLYGIDSKLQ